MQLLPVLLFPIDLHQLLDRETPFLKNFLEFHSNIIWKKIFITNFPFFNRFTQIPSNKTNPLKPLMAKIFWGAIDK